MDVVIGAAFGDEGKGLITDHIASRFGRDAMVVRFNGGAQAGHTVTTKDNQRHVFRHIGSGSFRGASTFLSRFFVVNPILFLDEINQLQALGLQPNVYVDPACIITTPYDMMINQIAEDSRSDKRHGSCGVGFAETIERNQHACYSLTVGDIENSRKTSALLHAIQQEWVPQRLSALNIQSISDEWKSFLQSTDVFEFFIDNMMSFLKLITISRIDLSRATQPIIFEGAQGLMLDQDQGWFPHVTRSYTGLKNVVKLINDKDIKKLKVTYVTRSYLTRHGAGPLPHALSALPYKNVIDKTNIANNYQGDLRYAWFNLTLLNHFIQSDLKNITSNIKLNLQLAVTCLDQVEDTITFVENDTIYYASQHLFLKKIKQTINVSNLLCSYGPTSESINSWEESLVAC